ncbi:nuclear RNA export factor 1 [Neodiprion pinetum]|uniref:Nuclear RNA export factor 1-like n=1 Tax=Neodiprion lecontei TaxID=441921 RepID=A0A6J0BP90_NEOLC|nr:nuclear RNA export factor 1-like [Neodiprion lecontei]XP_046476524.1 nuclear RNA export factor 1-like [Neodiprion pinetum]
MASAAATAENKISWEPLRLTHLKPSFNNHELALAARQDLWHKFIIFDAGKYEKDEVLITVINACEPEVLLPVMYHVERGGNGTFLTKCNAEAIKNLVKQNLCVITPSGNVLNIDIILGFLSMEDLQLNPTKTVAQALYYKYESGRKILNLENFQKVKSLGSIYCPVAAPRILLFVLRCAKMGIIGNLREMKLPIRELVLRHNGISAFVPFEKFFNYHLTKLDLRFNEISEIDYLRYFAEFKITELWLDGNPLCTKYATPEEYIRAIKNIFPYIQKLDGIIIGVERKLAPVINTNYIGDGTKLGLVKQFIRHFFTLYDQEDRIVMNGLYDRDAFYSMTIGNAPTYTQKSLNRVFANNRNLLKFVDYAKCQEYLLRGPEKIISALRKQPPTTHNLRSFHVDLLHQGEKHLVISVQGLFYYKSLIFQLMLFNRTFVIVAKDDNEYSIVNDQCHLDVAPASFTTGDNKDSRFEPKDAPRFKPTLFSHAEKDQLIGFLSELSTMNRETCKKYLETSKWDIRVAINSFMKAYMVNDVPNKAFQ